MEILSQAQTSHVSSAHVLCLSVFCFLFSVFCLSVFCHKQVTRTPVAIRHSPFAICHSPFAIGFDIRIFICYTYFNYGNKKIPAFSQASLDKDYRLNPRDSLPLSYHLPCCYRHTEFRHFRIFLQKDVFGLSAYPTAIQHLHRLYLCRHIHFFYDVFHVRRWYG